jgi:hypothetical protein
MKKITPIIAMVAAMMLVVFHAECGGADDVDALIAKLGSTTSREREAASKELKNHPEAAAKLRAALKSPDREVSTRAARVLEYLEAKALRDGAKDGRADLLVDALVNWPEGKDEQAAWDLFCEFARPLVDRTKVSTGKQLDIDRVWKITRPAVIKAKRITEATKTNEDFAYFLRAEEVDIDPRRREPLNSSTRLHGSRGGLFIVASRSVRTSADTKAGYIILCGGNVNLGPGCFSDVLIVAKGDVALDCEIDNSLIIAQGKVTCDEPRYCRIVAGKEVVAARKPRGCDVQANEPSLLGLVRWSDAPKDKAAPKAK